MEALEKTKLVTNGELIKDLKRFEKNKWYYDVVCTMPDFTACCITGIAPDEKGDICIYVEDGVWDVDYHVDEVLAQLRSFDKNAGVYMAGCGVLMAISVDGGEIFACDNDAESVSCDAVIIGEYHAPAYRDSHEDHHLTQQIDKKERREDNIMTIVLIILMIFCAIGLVYNVMAIINHSGQYLLNNVLWAVVFLVSLVISSCTLYFSKDDH